MNDKKIFKNIQEKLIKLIPEKWKSIYLYASVINNKGGEMYFYYLPKRIIKVNPINCYNIANKFNIDEEIYDKKLKELYNDIKELHKITKFKWTNITLIMEKDSFKIEFYLNDLSKSKYSDEERRTLWLYKNLNIPIENLSAKDKKLVKNYKDENKPIIYTEGEKKTYNPILKCGF